MCSLVSRGKTPPHKATVGIHIATDRLRTTWGAASTERRATRRIPPTGRIQWRAASKLPGVTPPYWNHNIHYQPLVLDAVPSGCQRALDVGSGDGLLARQLAERAAEVVGVDPTPAMVKTARSTTQGLENVSFLQVDLVKAAGGELPDGGFDYVCSVTTVHQIGLESALTAMRRLLAPGGRLFIVGLAKDSTLTDTAITVAAGVAHRWFRRRRGGVSAPEGMPIMDGDISWGEVRRIVTRDLPGARYRRHLLWRYSVLWDKPES